MSPRFDLRHLQTAFLVTILVSAAATSADDQSCFVERGRIRTPHITAVAISGRLVAAIQQGGWDTRPVLRVAEMKPLGLIETGRWQATWYVSDIALNAATAVIAADDGLISLDLTDPHNPAETDFVGLAGVQHLAVSDGLAYVATSGAGGNGWFDIVNVTDPGDLERNGQLYWGRPDPWKSGIAAASDLVAIADNFGLLFIDVSNPWQPVEVGRWSHSGVRDVALIGDLAVAAVTFLGAPAETGISVVDITNPNAPTPIGSWPAPSAVHSVAEYGGAVVVGTESDGLFLIDLSDPAGPAVIDRWQAPGLSVEHLATAWPTIAFSDFNQGAVVLGLRPSCLPPRRPSGRVGP
jgi:hypothetical protein